MRCASLSTPPVAGPNMSGSGELVQVYFSTVFLCQVPPAATRSHCFGAATPGARWRLADVAGLRFNTQWKRPQPNGEDRHSRHRVTAVGRS